MNITLTPATLEEKPILEHLTQLYLYDFTEFDQADINEDGFFPNKYFPLYWTEPNRCPFIIRVDGNLAGFVLVRLDIEGMLDPPRRVNQIAEFFIMKKYRRCGVGEFAARWTFEQFPGAWEVHEVAENSPAQKFWRKTIGNYTQGNYQEVIFNNQHHHGPIQTFSNI